MAQNSQSRFVKIAVASVAAGAFLLAPLVTAGTALADGDQDSGTVQLPPTPPKDDVNGHFWID